MMQCARILAVTGASGVGKTTLVREVEARGVPGVSFHYFDSVGVPTPEEMARDYAGPEGWQGESQILTAAPRAEVRCELTMHPHGQCRRQPIALELHADDQPFGQVAEALVTIGSPYF